MNRIWPWSGGAPADEAHSELEEQMSPDPQIENAAYDLKVARQQATAGEAGAAQQAGARAKSGALQQR